MPMATKTAKKGGKKAAVRYIVNARGKKMETVLPISVDERLLEQAEELDDIRAFDKARMNSDFVPWEEAVESLDGSSTKRKSRTQT